MTSSELAQLRSTLQELQSCKLPANSRIPIDKENAIATTAPLLFYNPELLSRYKAARNAYIQQKTIDDFLSSLENYDRFTLPLPGNAPTDAQREELAQRQEEVLNEAKQTMAQVSGGMDGVRMKWEQFVDKREELAQIVEGMERQERNRRLEEGDNNGEQEAAELMEEEDGEEDISITEDDVALQEEKLDELQQRKLELENRLRSVRAQVLDAEDDCHRTKRVVNEVRVKGGRKPLDWRGLNNSSTNSIEKNAEGNEEEGGKEGGGDENVEYISVVAQDVDSEIAQMQEKAAELQESSDFYDGIRELMEELGGVKILSSKSIPASASSSDAAASPEKRQKLEEEGLFVLTLMLLGSHILEITLSKSSTDKHSLRVSNAKLTTDTTFPMPGSSQTDEENNEETTSLMQTMHSISLSNLSFSKIMSQKPSVEVTIPPLDDLVSWSTSTSLESCSSSSIRFILVETMARIRTLDARIAELTTLRERYAAQVYDVESSEESSRYGGAEQEVVCAINEGITVALRLGADCPLVPGSIYISDIFGVGGWDQNKLEELKNVVMKKRCRGPVEVMQCMVKEIRRRSKEEGWVVPATPSLPRCK